MSKKIFSAEVLRYIWENRNELSDRIVFSKGEAGGVPIRNLAVLIEARKKAKNKLGEWYKNPGVLFPSSRSVEQSSSDITAAYKQRFLAGGNCLDITGGLGIDSYHFSKVAGQVTYLEQDPSLVEFARHNFTELGATNVSIEKLSAENFLANCDRSFDLVYADPDRRASGKRVFRLEESSPNVVSLLPQINNIAENWLIKLSPLFDIKELQRKLTGLLEVHILALNNEVKELLAFGSQYENEDLKIICTDLSGNMVFSYHLNDLDGVFTSYDQPLNYLYEPNAAIMKSGAFNLLGMRYGLSKLGENSHLYTSLERVAHFPGRIRRIVKVVKPRIGHIPSDVVQEGAMLTLRNFPGNAEKLRKEWKLPHGQKNHIYLTTINEKKRVAIITEPVR